MSRWLDTLLAHLMIEVVQTTPTKHRVNAIEIRILNATLVRGYKGRAPPSLAPGGRQLLITFGEMTLPANVLPVARRALFCLAIAVLLIPVPALAAGPTPSPPSAKSPDRRVKVQLRPKGDRGKLFAAFARLDFHVANEQRVMTAMPGGKHACISVIEGDLPTRNLAALRDTPAAGRITVLTGHPAR